MINPLILILRNDHSKINSLTILSFYGKQKNGYQVPLIKKSY